MGGAETPPPPARSVYGSTTMQFAAMNGWLALALCLVACGSTSEEPTDGGAVDLSATHSTTDAAASDPSELGQAMLPDMALTPPPDLASPLSIVANPLPYDTERLAQMAKYSLDHYGISTSVLVPQLVVLHFTDGPTWTSAYNLFAANEPNRGEMPGTCAHYIVEQNGTIHGLVDPSVRCRHAVGVNHVAIGIEIVQESLNEGGAWADQQILARPAQIDAVLALVHWLQAKYAIDSNHVIGHATANASPLFLDLEGWTNDHVDWLEPDVVEFRKRLDALP